jgi:hypothetical protein
MILVSAEQEMADRVARAFRTLDAGFLAGLEPAERAAQYRARDELYRYAQRLWDHLKASVRAQHGPDIDFIDSDQGASAAAVIYDLAGELFTTAFEAQADDPDA